MKVIYFFNYYILGIGLGALISLPMMDYIANSNRINHDIMEKIFFLKDNFFKLNSFSYYISAILRLFSNNLSGFGKYFFGFCNYYESPMLFSGSILSTIFIVQGFFIKRSLKYKITFLIVIILYFSYIVLPSISLIINGLQYPSYR